MDGISWHFVTKWGRKGCGEWGAASLGWFIRKIVCSIREFVCSIREFRCSIREFQCSIGDLPGSIQLSLSIFWSHIKYMATSAIYRRHIKYIGDFPSYISNLLKQRFRYQQKTSHTSCSSSL